MVRRNAADALRSGPWSVTTHRPENVTAGPNDYYSEGPYWWPDPKNPKGPYIRKDGERNPGRFMGNRKRPRRHVLQRCLRSGMGAFLLGDKACGEHASRVLSTWFVDPKTRMNPNLEYGQAVRGINTGRGTGLIDTVSSIHAAQGIWLLEQAGMLESSVGRRGARLVRGFPDLDDHQQEGPRREEIRQQSRHLVDRAGGRIRLAHRQ